MKTDGIVAISFTRAEPLCDSQLIQLYSFYRATLCKRVCCNSVYITRKLRQNVNASSKYLTTSYFILIFLYQTSVQNADGIFTFTAFASNYFFLSIEAQHTHVLQIILITDC